MSLTFEGSRCALSCRKASPSRLRALLWKVRSVEQQGLEQPCRSILTGWRYGPRDPDAFDGVPDLLLRKDTALALLIVLPVSQFRSTCTKTNKALSRGLTK